MDRAFLQERITKIKARIIVYEDALLALGEGGAQSYTLDTGQTRTTVTKTDLVGLQKTLDGLLNQCVVYEARLNGSGTHIARPGF